MVAGWTLKVLAHFWGSAKGDAALAGVDKTIPRSLSNKGALEFGNAGEDRQNHPARWAFGIDPRLIKRL
jgi:hypothetical protein